MKPNPKKTGPGAVELLEEAVQWLRRHPGELVWYYAGTGPFAVGLVYFWSYVTWFRPADGSVALGALCLSLVFVWMKVGQHVFATHMLALRSGDTPERFTLAQGWRAWKVQARLQSWGLLLVPLAAVFTVPFAMTYGNFQCLLALPAPAKGAKDTSSRDAWSLALLWPRSHHLALLIFSVLWILVLLNVAVTFYAVPTLATRWLGLKTVFALEGWSYFNSTFWVLITALTHLLVDPLIKMFYVLRVFHGLAQSTGADLRLVLQRERSRHRRATSGVTAVLLLWLMVAVPQRMRAETAAPAPVVETLSSTELDEKLDSVLNQPEFRWRLQRPDAPANPEEDGLIKGFVRATFDTIGEMMTALVNWIKGIGDWLDEVFPKSKDSEKPRASGEGASSTSWADAVRVFAYAGLLGVLGLLVFVTFRIIQRAGQMPPSVKSSDTIPPAAPDLRDENVEASRLPADGWLDLARQQRAAGEWRLCLRALFLATLARRAHEGLLSLSKSKTNLEYESELRRRAHGRPGLVDDFSGRRRQFEEVWYGDVPAGEGVVAEWIQKLEASS